MLGCVVKLLLLAGLCGTYDDDSSNDLTSRFGQVFQLADGRDPDDFTGTWG